MRSHACFTSGIYLDMDMECVQPLLSGLERMKSACVLDQERWEQTRVYHDRDFSAMNSAMACTPRHPFFKHLIHRLPNKTNPTYIVHETGPFFLTAEYKAYKKLFNGTEDRNQSVTLAHPEVFSPYIADLRASFITHCRSEWHLKVTWQIVLWAICTHCVCTYWALANCEYAKPIAAPVTKLLTP